MSINVSLALLMFAFLPAPAFAAERSDVRRTLEEFMEDEWRLPQKELFEAFTLQFEYRVIYGDVDNSRELRWQFDNSLGPKVRACSADGVPFQIGRGSNVWILNSTDVEASKKFRAGFDWNVERLTDLNTVPGFRPDEYIRLRIDLSSLVKDLWDARREDTAVFRTNPPRAAWTTRDSTRVDVAFTRERVPEHIPVKEIRCRLDDGNTFALTNISAVHSRDFSATQCLRSLSSSYAICDQPFQKGTHEELRSCAEDSFSRALKNPQDLTVKAASESSKQAIWELTASKQKLSAQSTANLRQLLVSLRDDARRPSSLSELTGILTEHVIEPIRVQKVLPEALSRFPSDKLRPPVFLTGHERWRVRELLEVVLAPRSLGELREGLDRVALAEQPEPTPFTIEDRLTALDLIGELGLTPERQEFQRWDDRLRGDRNDEIRLMWSAVLARQGVASDADIKLLRFAMTNHDISDRMRWICLEALLLLDATDGLKDEVVQAFQTSAGRHKPLGRRCKFAAGCAREGREVLCDILRRGPQVQDFEEALALAETSIGPDDEVWQDCQSIVESVALDKGTPRELAVRAAAIASLGDRSRSFHDAFVRSVLRSHQLPYWQFTGWRYLRRNDKGEKFVEEFEEILRTGNLENRRAAAHTVFSSFSRIPESKDIRAAYSRVFLLLTRDSDFEVRRSALSLFCILRDHKTAKLVDQWLPLFVEMTRNETDPEHFAEVATEICGQVGIRMNVSLRFDATQPSYPKRSADEVAALVRVHRDEIQKSLDDLVR